MTEHPNRERLAATCMCGAALLFAAMALLTKRAVSRLPGPEVAFVRFSIGIAACAVAALRIRFRARNWTGLLLRGVFGGSAVLCYFLTIEHLSVGVATLLNYTSPVFTALWAALFLGERLSAGIAGALLLTTFGVGMVIEGNALPGSLGLGRWEMLGIFASVLSGAAVATIRQVRRTDGSWEIFASFCIVGMLVTAPPMLLHWVAPSPTEWLMLLGVGTLAVIAQLLMTYALRFLRAAVAGILMQLTPIGALLFGALLFDEHNSRRAIMGAAITLLGVSWGAWLVAAPSVPPDEN